MPIAVTSLVLLAVYCAAALGLRLAAPSDRLVLGGLLLLAAVAWLRANSPIEGPVLIAFTARHGFTAGDLGALPALPGLARLVFPGRGRFGARGGAPA